MLMLMMLLLLMITTTTTVLMRSSCWVDIGAIAGFNRSFCVRLKLCMWSFTGDNEMKLKRKTRISKWKRKKRGGGREGGWGGGGVDWIQSSSSSSSIEFPWWYYLPHVSSSYVFVLLILPRELKSRAKNTQIIQWNPPNARVSIL